ncbi:MAG: replication-relaxation family protein [Dactylosporangium sp.]|nr:replication-relaxation family protein [Dactylosporangium sp.]NNJ60724.1 replication-relaxation family protein [Dactylosporangium sp.]
MTDPLLRLQYRLTNRDHTLLGWLADHGVLTTPQIAHALFPSVDVAQERLLALTRAGVLARFRPQRPDGGTHPYHYVLDQLGANIVASQRGEDQPRRDQARHRRWHLTNRANLPHLLGVNQFFINLAAHARTHPGCRLERWWPAARCQRCGAFADASDETVVRAYTPVIRPDGHGIWAENGQRVPFFVEYDLGTEPLPTLIDKLDRYTHLVRHIHRSWPVLFSLPGAIRERNLQRRLADTRLHVAVATTVRDPAAFGTTSPAEAVWWLHQSEDRRVRLADLADRVVDLRRRAA